MDNLISDYIYTIIILLILSNAATIIFYLFKKIYNQAIYYELLNKSSEFKRSSLEFKLLFLKVLRREIGSNRLLSKEELLEAEEVLDLYDQSLNKRTKEEVTEIIAEMDSKYPNILLYDFWKVRFFYSISEYKDKVEDTIGKEVFKGLYLDLCKRIIVIKKYYPFILGAIPETQLKEMKSHFRHEPDKEKEAMNKELRERLREGINRYDSFRKDFQTMKDLKKAYKDDEYLVDHHLSEETGHDDLETQITIKRPYQYGIISWSSWSSDYSFYMTDKNFKNRVHIGSEDRIPNMISE